MFALAAPETFLQTIGAVLLAFAIVFAAIALIPSLRPVGLRLFAILTLSGLAAFSNHWTTYFAAIFIIATAVTELEFLQTLAAIVRGDKNYFDFRREFLTRAEVLAKAERDASMDAGPSTNTTSAPKPTNPSEPADLSPPPRPLAIPIASPVLIEDRALDWFEKSFGLKLQRFVRVLNRGVSIELDAVAPNNALRDQDTVVEVKFVRYPHPRILRTVLELVAAQAKGYRLVTGHKAEFIVLLIVPAKDDVPDALVRQLLTEIPSTQDVTYRVLVLPCIELNLVVDTISGDVLDLRHEVTA